MVRHTVGYPNRSHAQLMTGMGTAWKRGAWWEVVRISKLNFSKETRREEDFCEPEWPSQILREIQSTSHPFLCQRHFNLGGKECRGEGVRLSHIMSSGSSGRHDDDEKVPPDVGPPSPTSSLKILVHSTQPLRPLLSLCLSWTFLGMPLPQHCCICCPLWLECFLHPYIMAWLTISPPSSFP